MTHIRIISVVSFLLLLTLPLTAHTMGSEAKLQALITAAETEVTATPAWQQAGSGERQKLTEEAVRRKIITTVRSRFDKMQLEVDRKVEEVLDKALAVTSVKLVTSAQQERIRELFMEEWYKYMYLNKSSSIEVPYSSAKGSELGGERILSNAFRGEKLVENEIGEVLENINLRMGGVLDIYATEEIKQYIFKQFNLLR
ncbi:MAG: hypothetical protein HXX17_16620 [Geobacteraceae bacterium]|nr:hypothetical protein [Geobacteraceae bacterium]